MAAADLNALCAKCHRIELGSPAENRDVRDARNVRNQPLMLAASACFRGARGRLTCLTCHAPHAELERQAGAYDKTCQRCHAAARHKQPVAGQACAGCHMPDGRGAVGAGAYPALARNAKLEAAGYPVLLVVNGRKAMPAFGRVLDDNQVAAVVNYIRANLGNAYTDRVSVDDVKAARQ